MEVTDNFKLLSPPILGNFAANGALGLASATVDVTSFIRINQTTAGISLTLPSPTVADAGLMFKVANTGTASLTVAGIAISAGSIAEFVWSGTAWQSAPSGGGANNDFFRSANGTVLPDGTTDFTEGISHNGGLSIGLATDPAVANALQIGKSFIRDLAVNANFGASGATGSPNTTSGLIVTQTTPGVAITIVNGSAAGQIFTIASSAASTVSFTAYGQTISPGNFIEIVWSGTSWMVTPTPTAPDFWRSGAAASLPDGVTDTTDIIFHQGLVNIGSANNATGKVGAAASAAKLNIETSVAGEAALALYQAVNAINASTILQLWNTNVFAAQLELTNASNTGIYGANSFVMQTPAASNAPIKFGTNGALRMQIKTNGVVNIVGVQTFANDAAAGVGGLVTGDIYKSAAGILSIKL
jgi:hypothetical protein